MVMVEPYDREFNTHTGHGSLLEIRQVLLPRYASIYAAANNCRHCWEVTSDGLVSRPGESVQLHSKLLASATAL